FVFSLLFLLVQVIVGLDFTWYPTLNPNIADSASKFIRFPGVFYDPQSHGQYLALGSFLFLISPSESKRKTIIINLFIFVIAIVAISLTGSRSAFGGFAIGLFLVFILLGKRYIHYAIAFSVIGIFAYN